MPLYHISLDYATYGLMVEDDIVTETPPIAKWMIGEPWEYVRAWLAHKGATIEEVD